MLIVFLLIGCCGSPFKKADNFAEHCGKWYSYSSLRYPAIDTIRVKYDYQDKNGFDVTLEFYWNKKEIKTLLESTNKRYHEIGLWLLHDFNRD